MKLLKVAQILILGFIITGCSSVPMKQTQTGVDITILPFQDQALTVEKEGNNLIIGEQK